MLVTTGSGSRNNGVEPMDQQTLTPTVHSELFVNMVWRRSRTIAIHYQYLRY